MYKANILLDAIPFHHYYTNVETFLTFQAPEPAMSQFPVTDYTLSCTFGEGDICSETLPADTSYNLTVDAGV